MDCLPSVSDDVITNELDAYGATVHRSESLTQLGESSETAPHANECVSPDDTLQRSCALYLLTLKEKYKLTQTAVDFVVSQTKDTIQTVNDNLHQSVHDSICSGNQPNFDHIFESAPNPYSGLETQYLQSKYIENNLGVVVCM